MSYVSTHEHLQAELARINKIIEAFDPDQLAEPLADETTASVESVSDPQELTLTIRETDRQKISELTTTIREDCASTDEVRLRLRVLAETCGLSRRHLDVLMLALAPDLDSKYADHFQTVQNSQALTRPTLSYLETLFGSSWTDQLAAGWLVRPDSPLRQHDLISLQTVTNATLRRRRRLITPSEWIVEYLKGYDAVDADLKARLKDHAPPGVGALDNCEATTSVDDLAVSENLEDQLTELATRDGHRRCYWYGPASEKHRAVEYIFDQHYLRADLRAVLDADVLDWLAREAALLGRPLALTNATTATDSTDTSIDAIFETLAEYDLDVIITGSESWLPTESLSVPVDEILEFPYPSISVRRTFWESHATELPDDLDPNVLAGTFRLTRKQLQAALSTARTLADGEITVEDVYAGCSAQSTSQLGELADRIEPDSSWDEIQLRAETERKLQLVQTHITQQARIYTDWGFEERFNHGTGVVALFEGPSGTGKTMAAEILAGEVGMDLYRIDLSAVVSKYIGETEEKLEAIFKAATNANAILLFDEADAVFGDRTEVSDSTDRYANAEVNYLLQRIERYDGVVLLTTNYASQIDSAFERRLDHTVRFKQPQQDTRSAIWHEMFPDQAPLGEIDYEFLSDFEFTGGQIKTIAQRAAILAADDGQYEPRIEMQHLVEAIQLAVEQKGLMVDPADYEPYARYLYDGRKDSTNSGDTESTVDAGQSDTERTSQDAPTNEDLSTTEVADDITDKPAQTVEESETESLSPESVVRTYYDRLDCGDPAIHELYHSNAIVEPISRKQLRRAQHTADPALGDLQRVQDEPSRVRIECVRTQERGQNQEPKTIPLSIELRLDDDEWRVFHIEESQRRRPRST